jgi:hypothetical protein
MNRAMEGRARFHDLAAEIAPRDVIGRIAAPEVAAHLVDFVAPESLMPSALEKARWYPPPAGAGGRRCFRRVGNKGQ